MDYASIKELIKIVNDSELTTFEMEFDGVILKMGKGGVQPAPVTQEKVKPTPVSKPSKIEDIKEEVVLEEEKGGTFVTSPIVGTFYGAPSAEKPPFVKVGDKVKKGDVLCIIEAMKIMNEIQSDVDGEVAEILVPNEQMVEYGQKLFRIK